MKKFLVILYFGITIPILIYLIYCLFVPYKFYQFTDIVFLNKAADRIYYDNYVHSDFVFEVDTIYNSLPELIKLSITKNDWIFVLTNDIQKYLKSANSDYMAVTNRDRHITYIKVPSTLPLQSVIYHEAGHILDIEYDLISISSDFTQLYLSEHQSYYQIDSCNDFYSKINNMEFFASSFKDYYLYPDHLKAINPKLYHYFYNLTNT